MIADPERRLAEIELIQDQQLREATADAVSKFPRYYWEAPAASSYSHHHPFSCDKHGLWIHTKMTATAYFRLAPSFIQQSYLKKDQDWMWDVGLVGALTHDALKYGDEWIKGESTEYDHDVQGARWIQNETDLPQLVADIAAKHMGPWGTGPSPEQGIEQCVHQADMIAADKNVDPGLYKPPEEIIEMYPQIGQAVFPGRG